MKGDLHMGSNRIIYLGDPTGEGDAASKNTLTIWLTPN